MNYTRKCLAIHEAGHAIVALYYNLEPSIRSGEEGAHKGFVAATAHNATDTVDQKVTLLVAGAAACHVFGIGRCTRGADRDFKELHPLLQASEIEPFRHAARAIAAFSEAVRIIESRRVQAVAIADAFYERAQLTAEDIRLIVAGVGKASESHP